MLFVGWFVSSQKTNECQSGVCYNLSYFFFFNFQFVCLTFFVECSKYYHLDTLMALGILMMVVDVFLFCISFFFVCQKSKSL